MPDKDPDIVAEIGDMIEYFTTVRGLPDVDGFALSSAVCNWIRENYQGERVRIRKGQRGCQYSDQIRAEFDGTNLAEIMERYGVGRSTVYRHKKQ